MSRSAAHMALVGGLATVGTAMAQDATFRGLGYSGIGGSLVGSRADAVSPDGFAFVGGDDTDFGTLNAFWDERSFSPDLLRDADGSYAPGRGVAVSEQGLVTVGSWNTLRDGALERRSMVWQAGGRGLELESLPNAVPLSGSFTFVGDVSGDGTLAVGVAFDDRRTRQPVTWDTSTGAIETLALLPGRSGGQANRISTDGRTIVGSQFGGADGVDPIVFWTDGVPQSADATVPDGFDRFEILGISPDASIVTGQLIPVDFDPFSNPIRPAAWSSRDGIEILDTLGGGIRLIDDAVLDASTNGRLKVGTVGAFAGGSPYSAAVWFEDGSIRGLQEWLTNEFGLFEPSEWRGLLEATSISDDGTVLVGYGINPFGVKEGFVVTLPSPNCLMDFDVDGSLTLFDFLAFQNLFDARDPRADVDEDGRFTLFDFLTFQTLFDAGC